MSSPDPVLQALTPPPAPPPALEARVRAAIGEVRPVRPLAPPAARAAIAAFLGLGVVTVFASPVADGLPRQQDALALALLAAAGFWIAMMLAVPGRGRARRPGLFWLAIPVLFCVRVLATLGTEGGVHGVACLVIGSAVALLPLATSAFLAARAYPLEPVLTGAVAGVSAGTFGLALLTLNCPVVEGPHLAIFHGGVLVLSLLLGAATGFAHRALTSPLR